MSGTEHVTAATRTVDANGDGYPTNRTALLLIDPYNDFLRRGRQAPSPTNTMRHTSSSRGMPAAVYARDSESLVLHKYSMTDREESNGKKAN